MQREGMYIFSSRVHTHDLQLMGISNEAGRMPKNAGDFFLRVCCTAGDMHQPN
jgi:hypothetical protein